MRGDREQGAGDREQGTGSRGQGAGDRGWRVMAIMLVFAASVALLLAALSRPTVQEVQAGAYRDWDTLRGWYSPQPLAGTTGRWSAEQARLVFAPQGAGAAVLQLRLIAPDPPGTPASVRLTSSSPALSLQFAVVPQPRLYRVLVPLPPGGGESRFVLESSLQVAPTPTYPQGIGVGITEAQLRGPLTPGGPLPVLLSAVVGAGMLALLVAWGVPDFSGGWLVGPAVLLCFGGLVWFEPLERTTVFSLMRLFPWMMGWLSLCIGGIALFWGRERARQWVVPGLVLPGAAVLRFWGLNWDDGFGFHTDEGKFNEFSRELHPPWHPNFFNKGALLLYLYRAIAELLAATGHPHWLHNPGQFALIGREVSAGASLLTVLLVLLIGWRSYRYGVGVWAMLLLSGVVLAIQHAHFGTTDSLLTLELLLLTALCLHYLHRGGWLSMAGAGVVLGLSVATKMTAVLFGFWPLFALLLRVQQQGEGWGERIRVLLRHGSVLAGAALVACFVGSPYYFLDWRGLLHSMQVEAAVVTAGRADYTNQFIGTIPYLYQLYNALVTMGPPLVLLGLAGWGYLLVRGLRGRGATDLLLVVGPTLYLLVIGRMYAKYTRYLLPLLPFLCLYGGLLLDALWRRGGWQRWLSRLGGGTVVALTAGYGILFAVGVYGQPDPRLVASAWVYQQVKRGSVLLYDEVFSRQRLPVALEEPENPLAMTLRRTLYNRRKLWVYDAERNRSPDYYAEMLPRGDYIILASRSQHITFRRLPKRFPVQSCFYRLLFAEKLGYVLVKEWSRGPRLGTWRIDAPDNPWLEETFQIFDHPTVFLFARRENLDAATVEQAFRNSCPALAAP